MKNILEWVKKKKGVKSEENLLPLSWVSGLLWKEDQLVMVKETKEGCAVNSEKEKERKKERKKER